MSESNFNATLGGKLERAVPPAPHDPGYIAFEAMRRDLWRTRILATLSLLFWLAGGAGMLFLIFALNRLVLYIRLFLSGAAPATTRSAKDFAEMVWGTNLIHHGLPYIGGGVIALMLAAILTVMLVFSSRRATLNRINISLIQLTEQLREMRATTDARK
jgi:hypothetical protein